MIIPKQSLLFSLSVLSFFNSLIAAPVINELSSPVGPSIGGNELIIKGKGFNNTEQVIFGTIPAGHFSVQSDNLIVVTAPEGTPGTVDITVKVGDTVSPTSQSNHYTYKGEWSACITNGLDQNNFSTINPKTNSSNPSISLNGTPLGIIISADAKHAYIANFSLHTVSIIDMVTKNELRSFNVGTNPISLAITPDGKKIYVVNSGSDDMSVINLETNEIEDTIPVGSNPISVSIIPTGNKAYIVNAFSDSLSVINLTTKDTTEIPLPPLPSNIAISPDGKNGYVTCIGSNTLEVLDLTNDTIIKSVELHDDNPSYMAITPDGKKGYISNSGSGTVTSINLITNTLETSPIEVGKAPAYIAITPDSKIAYVVVVDDSTVVPIDITNDKVGSPISVEKNSYMIAITPDQAPIAKFNVIPSGAGELTNFDAGNSFSPVGSITTYEWNFGDGSTASTTDSFISHKYLSAGSYNVDLTVTNSAGTSTKTVFSGRMMSQNGNMAAKTSKSIEIAKPIAIAEPTPFKNIPLSTAPIVQTSPTIANAVPAHVGKNKISKEKKKRSKKSSKSSSNLSKGSESKSNKKSKYRFKVNAFTAKGELANPIGFELRPGRTLD